MKAILQPKVTQAEFTRLVWAAEPESGGTMADTLGEVIQPAYWAHVARSIKAGSIIELRPADGAWFAQLYVRASNSTGLIVSVLNAWDFSKTEVAKTDDNAIYEVKHRGPRGWSVVRKSDGKVVFENGSIRPEAEAWVSDHSLG